MKYRKQYAAGKSICTIALLLVSFSVTMGIIGFRGFIRALPDQYADGAFMTVDPLSGVPDRRTCRKAAVRP